MPDQTASPSLADPEARRRMMSEVEATPGSKSPTRSSSSTRSSVSSVA